MEDFTVIRSKLYDFILDCGSVHHPRQFAVEIINRMAELVPFDQARVYFVSGNGKITDQYITGIENKWVALYHEYYSKIEGGRYAIPVFKREQEFLRNPIINTRCWLESIPDEFVNDYVRAIGICYSLGFQFFDIEGWGKTYFMFDRTTPVNFSEDEIFFLRMAFPHLNNLHKNFYINPMESPVRENIRKGCPWNTDHLTVREMEVANLLCQGFTPQDISKKLHISVGTTRKHVEHIYKKLHVSSRQELLVRLLRYLLTIQ